MKYAAFLLTFALATPAFAQSTSVQSDPEDFKEMICDLRGICDPGEQDKAWAAASERRELGLRGDAKGPIATVTNLSGSSAASNSADRSERPKSRPVTRSRVIQNRRPPAQPMVAKVTAEVKGDAPLMVTFASGSAQLTPSSMSAVSTFANVLRYDEAAGKSDSKFLIEGHTDSVGLPNENQTLSQRRAQAVVDALVEMGFDAERFVVEGKGEAEPLDGRRGRDPVNRRVIAKAID